jgi:hypothetical protein
MLATLDQAQVDLEPYIARLRRCVKDGISQFQADYGPRLYKIQLGTQAGLVRDYIVEEIKTEFDGEAGVSYSTTRNLFLLNVGNRYFLRFKKLDRRLRTRNIPTQLSLDFLLQQPLSLPGMPDPATHLNVGYKPGLTLATSTVWVTCPDGPALEWQWEISEKGEPIQFPIPSATEARRSRVRPRALPDRQEASANDARP